MDDLCVAGRLPTTQPKTYNLFRVDENSLEQCCTAHIVQCCQQYQRVDTIKRDR